MVESARLTEMTAVDLGERQVALLDTLRSISLDDAEVERLLRGPLDGPGEPNSRAEAWHPPPLAHHGVPTDRLLTAETAPG